MKDFRQRSAGFTLIEVGIIVPLLLVSLLVVFSALYALLRSSALEGAALDNVYDAQNALNTVEKDVALTSGFLGTTDANITDPYKPTTNGSTWQYYGDSVSSTNRVLILRSYATVNNPASGSRSPAYLNTLGCTTGTNGTIYYNSVLTYNTIYFVKNNTLYRRIALDTTRPTCSTIYQKQSCTSADDLGGSQNAACKADDEVIATNVSSFQVKYYSAPGSTSELNVYTGSGNGALVTTAIAVDVSLTLNRKAYGTDVPYTSTIRLSKLNI